MLAATFKGPIPPPGVLQGYEDVRPGYADTIMGWAGAEGEERRRSARIEQWFTHGKDILGLLCSTGLCAWALWLGFRLLSGGHEVGGLATIIGAMVPLAGALILARKRNRS